MPTATITSKAQITLPKEIRDHLKLAEGDRVEFIIDASGEVRVRTVSGSVRKLHGLLQALDEVRGLDNRRPAAVPLGHDPVQSPLAQRLLEEAEEAADKDERFYVSAILLCDLPRLHAKPFNLDRKGIAAVVERVLDTTLFEVQDRDLVRQALADYRAGKADFPKYLLGRYHRQAGCSDTVTSIHGWKRPKGFPSASVEVALAITVGPTTERARSGCGGGEEPRLNQWRVAKKRTRTSSSKAMSGLSARTRSRMSSVTRATTAAPASWPSTLTTSAP